MNDDRSQATLGFITFDCVDEDAVASFWQELLGVESRKRKGPYVFMQTPIGVGLGFQHVDTVKAGKNRVHIDLDTDDLAATASRVLELGGSVVPGYEDGGFLVMADPEGNEFCLLPTGDWELDDEGRAHYELPQL